VRFEKSIPVSPGLLESEETMPTLELRSYQSACVDALRQSYAAGHRAPLLALPTGGGKTIIFADITSSASAKSKRVLVVVHRRELLKQASDKLSWAGVPHGIIAAGFEPDPGQLVQVASIQTVVRRLDKIGAFDLIVFDEAHHCQAETWKKLIETQPRAKLLGVTATPCRADGKGLGFEDGGCFDDLVVGPPIEELVNQGYLSPARCFVPAQRLDLHGVRTLGGDYVASDVARVVDTADITGDAVEQYRKRADHQPAIAFCATVEHAQHVAEAFLNAGYLAKCVHGGTPTDQRDAAIAGLGSGETEILTACDLISEGLDVPAVGAVILLRPTKSFGLHMQQVGRGMRPAPRKEFLIVNDHVGNIITHGLPTTDHSWTLKGVARRVGGRHLHWRCLECECLNKMSALTCVACGAPRPCYGRDPLSIAEGDLAELTAARLAAMRTMSFREMASTKRSEAELREFARAHKYHPKWVGHRRREQVAGDVS
jgi:DNA repair protein RadD